jgi:hypothetical protein
MRLSCARAFLLSSALVVSFAVRPATAQTSAPTPAMMASPSAAHKAAPVPAGSALVKVSSCSPQGTNPQGGPGGIAYIPGQAVSSYWPDVYSNTIYQPSASTAGPKLLITFTNISTKPMSTIEFGLLSNELLAGEVQDHGTFSPGVTIKHKLGLNLSAQLPGASRCVPLRIVFADGTKWRNPRLPAKGKYFNSKYTPAPFH